MKPFICRGDYHATVTEDEATGQIVIFALNRHLGEEMDLEVILRGFGSGRKISEALQIHHPNMKAVNTKYDADAVSPKNIANTTLEGDLLRVRLLPGSWNVIVTDPV